jgi:hypothetical protein
MITHDGLRIGGFDADAVSAPRRARFNATEDCT